MTKSDLIDKIAEKAGRSKSDAEQFLNATLSTVQDTLSSGESIPLVGFGTFSVASRAARTGKNPQPGADHKESIPKRFGTGKNPDKLVVSFIP